MTMLAERKALSVKKFTTEWMKCESCHYGNNFLIEIKKDEKDDKYFYAEKCPRCNSYGEFRECTLREAKKYLVLEDLA